MSSRRGVAITTTLALVLRILTYSYYHPDPTIAPIMSTSHDSNIPIKITLSTLPPSAATHSPLSLKVTLHNTHPTSPLHLLKWSTPLDTTATAQGIFVFTSVRTSEQLPSLGLKPNRLMPPNDIFNPHSEDIVKIDAGKSVDREVLVKEIEAPLEKGEKYLVKAKGTWLGVWVGEVEGGGLSLEEGRGVLRGNFESEEIEVHVPS